MKRFGYLTALSILIGLTLVSLPASAAAQSNCKATITTDKIEEGRNDTWTIWLSVDAGGCATSSGSFDYTLIIRRPGGAVDEVSQEGSWTSERPSSTFTLQYRMTGEGKLEDAREFRDIRCSCAGD